MYIRGKILKTYCFYNADVVTTPLCCLENEIGNSPGGVAKGSARTPYTVYLGSVHT
jgi:hypothetical protein